jgi:hypothetical protein
MLPILRYVTDEVKCVEHQLGRGMDTSWVRAENQGSSNPKAIDIGELGASGQVQRRQG